MLFFSYISAAKKKTKEGKEKDDSTTGNRIVETRRIHINIYPSNLSINKKKYIIWNYIEGENLKDKKKIKPHRFDGVSTGRIDSTAVEGRPHSNYSYTQAPFYFLLLLFLLFSCW